jgi:hypothetical protein
MKIDNADAEPEVRDVARAPIEAQRRAMIIKVAGRHPGEPFDRWGYQHFSRGLNLPAVHQTDRSMTQRAVHNPR